MKESEFLELLNLYLDHEISAADAARLEAEVSARPDRRRTYDEYCRMHKACSLVAMDFSAADGAVVTASDKVMPFEFAAAHAAARRRRFSGYVSGGLAAAACVAVAFVGFRAFTAPPSVGGLAAGHTITAERGEGVAAARAVPATTGVGPQTAARELGNATYARTPAPKWVTAPLILSEQKADAVMTAALRQAEDQLAWLQSVQFSPIQSRVQLEQIRFDAQPASLQPEGRALGGRMSPTPESAVEMAAFRFVK